MTDNLARHAALPGPMCALSLQPVAPALGRPGLLTTLEFAHIKDLALPQGAK